MFRRFYVLSALAVGVASIEAREPANGATPMSLTVASTAFGPNAEIPTRFTCEGEDISPPLTWTGAAANTKSFALIVDDPDAPDPKAPKMTWVHWVLYDIPPSVTSLGEGASTHLPAGVRQGVSDFKRTGYGGPCPPIGRHRYHFKVYALDTVLGDLGSPNKAALEKAMQRHIIAQGELIGTYQKKK
jgi:Raf kinase inhibitor-like YbhB/YbcL family protein